MQGAAQTANAAPSSRLDPRARASSPGATARSGHGSSPTNASPTTISRKPANSSCRRLVRATLPIAAAPAPSRTKTTVKPSDERQARERDPSTHAALAEAPRLDRRDRGQVAGHERQDARQDDRDEPDRERDRNAASRRSEQALRPPAARAPGRAAGRPAATARRSRRRDQRQASQPSTSAPSPSADERQHPREQVEPVLRRLGEDRRPELRRRACALISLFVSPAAMRAEMNCRIRSAIGAVDWSSVVLHVGHITSPSSSPSVGCRSLAAPAPQAPARAAARPRASLTS